MSSGNRGKESTWKVYLSQFGKPKGKVPERIKKRIQERWEQQNGGVQKPAQSTGTQKVLLKSFSVRVSVSVAL